MLRVTLAQAEPGMRLACEIHHPDHPGTVLLRRGYTLDDKAIARLHDMGFKDTWIEYPGLDFIAQHVSPEIMRLRGVVSGVVDHVFERLANDEASGIDYSNYRRLVRDLIRGLLDDPRAALFLSEMAEHGSATTRHSTDVCYLSLLMGLRLDAYLISERPRLAPNRAKEIVELGLGAMFHDIGMLELDAPTIERWQRTRDEKDPAFRQHVCLGFMRVRESIGPSAASAVLHHHQHFDGSGFPQKDGTLGDGPGLAGHGIHIFARIIACADLFDRLRHPPGELMPRPSVRALSKLQHRPYRDWIDPTALRALLAVAPAYPPGTAVRLSNGDLAAVVGWSPADPCRPRVQVIRSISPDKAQPLGGVPEHRRGVELPLYDLRQRTDLEIIEVDGFDVRADNFYPERSDQFEVTLDDSKAFRTQARETTNPDTDEPGEHGQRAA